MTVLQRILQYPMCCLGMHVPPPPRYPHGPVVSDCRCCGKTSYFYGLSAYGMGGPPVLMPAQPQRIISAAPAP
jgi:hypothetical protein